MSTTFPIHSGYRSRKASKASSCINTLVSNLNALEGRFTFGRTPFVESSLSLPTMTFYNEYCKAFLWPTFHYLGLTDHQEKDKEAKAWKAYYDANVVYAEKVAEVYKEGDLVSVRSALYATSVLMH